MLPYQQEYIDNINKISELSQHKNTENITFEEYYSNIMENKKIEEQIVQRNMQILKENLFPLLDNMFKADKKEIDNVFEFADCLLNPSEELDAGLYLQIHHALLGYMRQIADRNGMIRELYRMGIGHYGVYNKLSILDSHETEKYNIQTRIYFTEAAAYLKYFDEIEDDETRGFILRSRANMALGKFNSVSEKNKMVERSLMILQDKEYQKKAPNLPWDRYIFLAHQQMTTNIPYGRESSMSPQNVADIMESVQFVYETRKREAEKNHRKLPVQAQFSHYTIEYCCGIHTLDELLTEMEKIMDSIEIIDYSTNGIYGIISMLAFYYQYLNYNPKLIPNRIEYIEELNKRVWDYISSFPDAAHNGHLFKALSKLSYTYIETENGVSYKQFILKVLMCFAPDVYVHSFTVGKAARELCRIIINEEPDFFDDIEEIKAITDFKEKEKAVLSFAMECGLMHDIGKLSLINLYINTSRQWFENEYELAHFHCSAGKVCLETKASTKKFADIAFGHHKWYDGVKGYPEGYKRLDCPYRQLTDTISLVNWIDNITVTAKLYNGVEKTYEEAVEDVISLEGKRFSPLLTARLRDKNIALQLKTIFKESRIEAYKVIYNEMQAK